MCLQTNQVSISLFVLCLWFNEVSIDMRRNYAADGPTPPSKQDNHRMFIQKSFNISL